MSLPARDSTPVPPSFAELAAADRAAERRNALAREQARWYLVRRSRSRNRYAVRAVATALLLTGAGGGSLVWWQRHTLPRGFLLAAVGVVLAMAGWSYWAALREFDRVRRVARREGWREDPNAEPELEAEWASAPPQDPLSNRGDR